MVIVSANDLQASKAEISASLKEFEQRLRRMVPEVIAMTDQAEEEAAWDGSLPLTLETAIAQMESKIEILQQPIDDLKVKFGLKVNFEKK